MKKVVAGWFPRTPGRGTTFRFGSRGAACGATPNDKGTPAWAVDLSTKSNLAIRTSLAYASHYRLAAKESVNASRLASRKRLNLAPNGSFQRNFMRAGELLSLALPCNDSTGRTIFTLSRIQAKQMVSHRSDFLASPHGGDLTIIN
jgi:hypothetical protein